MIKIEIGNYFEIKKPLIYLTDENGEIVWFYDYKESIVCLEIIRLNFPRWTICVQTREEMIQNAYNSIKSGKTIEYLNEDLKKLFY